MSAQSEYGLSVLDMGAGRYAAEIYTSSGTCVWSGTYTSRADAIDRGTSKWDDLDDQARERNARIAHPERYERDPGEDDWQRAKDARFDACNHQQHAAIAPQAGAQ